MGHKGWKRWTLLGALASAVVLGAACTENKNDTPSTGEQFEGTPNESQDLDSFGQQPGTGGSGAQPYQQPQQQTENPQQPGPQGASGAQGREQGIGAPGHSTPQQTGTSGKGVSGSELQGGQGGAGVGGSTRTQHGGMPEAAGAPNEEKGNEGPGDDTTNPPNSGATEQGK